jgi:Zn-dependent protease
MIENAIENDILKPINGGYKFIANLKFLKYINRSIKGYKKAKKALEQNTIINDTPPEIEPLYKSSEQVILAQQLNEKPKEPNKRNKIKVFIVSGIAFMVLFGLIGVPWTVLPIIMTVLIVHELGHFWMMRYFGYEDTSIFFIPLFGAAAKGEKNDSTPFEEYMVYLAGPLPGIVISIAIGILMLIYPELRSSTLLREYALMSLVLNYINLLPIFPLDGGKIVQTLLFTRYPKAQFYFFLLSLLVIIFIGFMMESIFLGVFAMILFFSINQHHRTAQLIDSIMKQESSIPLKQRVIEMLTTQSPYKESSLVVKGSMAKQALKILNMQKPSKLLMFLGLGFYALLVFAPLILKIAIGFL